MLHVSCAAHHATGLQLQRKPRSQSTPTGHVQFHEGTCLPQLSFSNYHQLRYKADVHGPRLYVQPWDILILGSKSSLTLLRQWKTNPPGMLLSAYWHTFSVSSNWCTQHILFVVIWHKGPLSKKRNLLLPHRLIIPISSKGVLLYATSHRQDNTYHSLCYTSRGALAGTR